MSIPQEQQERLNAYFEGKLSAGAEINFLNEVAGDEALQKEFDWELLLRYQQFGFSESNQTDQPEFEPADAYIKRIEDAVKQAGTLEPEQHKPVIRIRRSMLAAAVFILALGAALFYALYFKKQPPELVRRNQPVKSDSIRMYKERPRVPENKDYTLAENTEKAERIYRQYYKKYTGSEEDPIEVSKFLYAYNEGRYDEVIRGAAGDVSSKGANAQSHTLIYLDFYQGISYLQIKKSAPAIMKFRDVLSHASPKEQVYYDASWYLAMAYIQSNHAPDAIFFLQQLADNPVNTPYKKRAAEILKLL